MLVIRGIAELAGVATPMMDKVITWCQRVCGKEYLIKGRIVGKDIGTTRCPQAFGFKTLDELMSANAYTE
jgi:hypothetical protein